MVFNSIKDCNEFFFDLCEASPKTIQRIIVAGTPYEARKLKLRKINGLILKKIK